MKIERNYLIGLLAGAIFLLVLTRLFTALIPESSVLSVPIAKAHLAPKNVPSASQYKIPPGNGIPTYSEIEAGIKQDNTRQEMVKVAMADRDKRMAAVNADARMRAQQQSEPEEASIPKDAKAKKPAASVIRWQRADPNPVAVDDVKKKGFFVR